MLTWISLIALRIASELGAWEAPPGVETPSVTALIGRPWSISLFCLGDEEVDQFYHKLGNVIKD